jgi:hypothetical protein
MRMKMKKKSEDTPIRALQIDKFKEAARQLETDVSEEHFDAKLKQVAKAPGKQAAEKHKAR